MTIKGNFHTQTSFCDGRDTPEQVVEMALRKGFRHLGFSGHMDPGVSMDFPQYEAEICRLQDKYQGRLEILRGVELDNVTGAECAPAVEYAIGSTHFIPIPGSEIWNRTFGLDEICEDGINGDQIICVDASPDVLKSGCERYYDGDYYAMSQDYYRFEAEVAKRLKPTFIGHFDLITRFNDLSPEEGGHFLDERSGRYLQPAMDAMQSLVAYGIPFEINLGAVNRGRKREPYPRTELLKALSEMGGEVLLSSDAHQMEKLDGGFDFSLHEIKACGFRHVNVLTREFSGKPALNSRALGQGVVSGPLYWKEIEL